MIQTMPSFMFNMDTAHSAAPLITFLIVCSRLITIINWIHEKLDCIHVFSLWSCYVQALTSMSPFQTNSILPNNSIL